MYKNIKILGVESVKKFSIFALIATLIVSITVLVPISTAASLPFTDIKSTNQELYNAVTEFYNDDVVFGVTSTAYKPSQKATRGETAQFIVNALGWKDENATNPGFKDTASSKYKDAIHILANKGIVNVSEKFNPNGNLTRAQVAKMIVLAYELELSTKTTTKFTDVNKIKDTSTKQYIATLVDYEITTGTTAKTFSPNNQVTRAQLTLFLYRGLEHVGEFEIISVE